MENKKNIDADIPYCKYAKVSKDKENKCVHHDLIFKACYYKELKINGNKRFGKKTQYVNVSKIICKICDGTGTINLDKYNKELKKEKKKVLKRANNQIMDKWISIGEKIENDV